MLMRQATQRRNQPGTSSCLDIFRSWRGAYQYLHIGAPGFDVDGFVVTLGRGRITVKHVNRVSGHDVLDGSA